MKQERTLTRFECDQCAIRTEESEQPKRVPYEDGWVYLYHLEFKTKNKSSISFKDKHFCSRDCMIKWITEEIETKVIKGIEKYE